jgi:hypothetical protein
MREKETRNIFTIAKERRELEDWLERELAKNNYKIEVMRGKGRRKKSLILTLDPTTSRVIKEEEGHLE